MRINYRVLMCITNSNKEKNTVITVKKYDKNGKKITFARYDKNSLRKR